MGDVERAADASEEKLFPVSGNSQIGKWWLCAACLQMCGNTEIGMSYWISWLSCILYAINCGFNCAIV